MTDTRPKVMVNILNIGTIQAGTESQMIQWMREYSDRYNFQLFVPAARPIPNNRNTIVEKFLEGDYDYLFQLDEDTVPMKNPFCLLEHDKDVVGGVYPGRGTLGYHFHAYYFGDKFPKDKKAKLKRGDVFFVYPPPEKRVGLQKVDAVATGCFLVKRHVLEKMYKAGFAPFEDMFDEHGVLMTNDDMAFCIKCWRLGIDVYADWDMICDHIKKQSMLEVIRFIEYAARTGKPVISMSDKEFHEHII